jgi:hypothetical protein
MSRGLSALGEKKETSEKGEDATDGVQCVPAAQESQMRFKPQLTVCPLQQGRAARDPKCCTACAAALFWLHDRTGSRQPTSPRIPVGSQRIAALPDVSEGDSWDSSWVKTERRVRGARPARTVRRQPKNVAERLSAFDVLSRERYDSHVGANWMVGGRTVEHRGGSVRRAGVELSLPRTS